MPTYNYKAIDAIGRSVDGRMTAPDLITLESQLAGMGHTLLDSTLKAESKDIRIRFLEKVKPRELIDFFIQFRGLLAAGVPMLQGLKGLRDGADNPMMKDALDSIVDQVQSGNTFTEAINRFPKIFNDQITNLVRAGEESGNMPETIKELIGYLEWIDGMKKDARQATLYPVAVLTIMSLFIGLLFTFVVPKFVALLTSLDVALPMPTIIVMTISHYMASWWWMLVIFIVVAPIAVGQAKIRSFRFLYWWDSMKLKIPIFGKLNLMFTISRFSKNFSTLYKSGIPVLQNLDLCEKLVGNAVMSSAIRDARVDIEAGMSLYESLGKYSLFNSMELMMISVGEQSGDLGSSLESISTYYNDVIPRTVKMVFSIMEPLIMLMLISIVGFTALAIFMPIVTLMGSMG